MKQRVYPVLLEMLVMILVFAVAAAVSVRLFVAADQISRDAEQLDRAVLLAQQAAEALPGGKAVEPVDGLRLDIATQPQRIPGLKEARITVSDDTGEVIYTLTTAWQEAIP